MHSKDTRYKTIGGEPERVFLVEETYDDVMGMME